MKKILILCLAILTLCACTDKTNSGTQDNHVSIKENLIESDIPSYKKEALALADGTTFVLSAVKSENMLYLYALNESRTNLFFEYDLNNNSCKQLDIDISGTVDGMDIADNILYILADEGDTEGNSAYTCHKYDIETHTVTSVTLDESINGQDGIAIIGFSVVDKQLYVNAGTNIYRFDNSGKISAEIEPETMWRGFIHSPNNSLMLYNYSDNCFTVQEMKPNLEFSKKYTFNTNYTNIFSGISENHIFVVDDTYIYSLDLETGNKKHYAAILLYNISTSNFIPLSDNSFFTVQEGVPTVWTASTEGTAKQTAILTCAAYGPSSELQSAVSSFNYNHDAVKIDMTDYSVYDDGMTKLMVEINAGKIPDLLDLSTIPADGLRSSGLLENLEPYLSQKNILPNILESLKCSNGIYDFVPAFEVMALATSTKYVTTPKLDIEALLELAEKAHSSGKSLFPQYITREDFISFILAFSGDSFVDIENNYCNFEDGLFADLIQFASELPSRNELTDELYSEYTISESRSILEDKQILFVIETGRPVSAVLDLEALYKGDIQFVGFPTNTGSGIAMTPFMDIAVSSASNFKDEIWTFFDYLLSEEYQVNVTYQSFMPVVNEPLEGYIERVVNRYKEKPVEELVVPDIEGTITVQYPSIDDETVSKAWDLIRRVDCLNTYNAAIYNIVLEECQAYFAGDKSIDETVKLIQDRAELYVNERL